MKPKRHAKILELITQYEVNTQEDLLHLLKSVGFDVTQATVSRDIKELRLIKTLSDSGKYKYSVSLKEEPTNFAVKFHSIFHNSVSHIDYAENFVVLKCYVGMAQAACAALDAMKWDGVVGTIAGDDTIFVLMRSPAQAVDLASELKKLMINA